VTGIVQGVGFRPFVYRVATDLSLTGYVLNLGDAGVRIIVEGKKKDIEKLIGELETRPPSISRVDSVTVDWSKSMDSFDDFIIEKSSTKMGTGSAPEIPPDIAICNECIREMRDPRSRWYSYPFTSCAACGPRYSTITCLPYDRPNTTMIEFPLCNACNTGYTSPLDRRYHAQTTACENCGPLYRLMDSKGNEFHDKNPVHRTANLLSEGAVIALQGIAGTHLVTKTSDPGPIRRLRESKQRFQRPFAIMAPDISALRQFANPTDFEIEYLTTWRRPIVLVRKHLGSEDVSLVMPKESMETISPGLDTVGVMLPYAPVHHLLFDALDESALVMTSANPTGVPMYIDPEVITSELRDVADYFLIHNRRIHQRSDDSVLKFVTEDSPVFIRRARGYVPESIELVGVSPESCIVSVGPEEKATAAILKASNAYLTQHIGDTDQVESVQFLRNAIDHMMQLVGIQNLDAVACDLHPEFLSTELAEQLADERNIPLFRVQHHHAHLASVLADNSIKGDTSIVCITADGYGYGPDGNAWGGDVLLGNALEYNRVGGLASKDYTGGDLSAKFAIRALMGIMRKDIEIQTLLDLADNTKLAPTTYVDHQTLSLLYDAQVRGVNIVNSTSVGRFLDAASFALGICSENSYDAECPMKLESMASKSGPSIQPVYIDSQGMMNLDTSESLKQLLNYKKQGKNPRDLAYSIQWHLGEALAEIACSAAEENQIDYVGFSGGVALNRIITKAIVHHVDSRGLHPLIHRRIPPGDGGVSLGQVLVAAWKHQTK
jgi:hydrogenase maturation protein HypF